MRNVGLNTAGRGRVESGFGLRTPKHLRTRRPPDVAQRFVCFRETDMKTLICAVLSEDAMAAFRKELAAAMRSCTLGMLAAPPGQLAGDDPASVPTLSSKRFHVCNFCIQHTGDTSRVHR
jgi:hypothetical protein